MTQQLEELKERVEQVLTDCITLAEKHYGRQFKRPTVLYDLTGTIAGTAWWMYWRIRLHPGLLLEHTEEFIMETVPHEFAHLVADELYPAEYKGTSQKREIHGPRWREVMAVLGAEPTRTHTYDMEEWAKPKTKYEYGCPHCNNMVVFTAKAHNEQQQANSEYRYVCTPCKEAGSKHILQFRRSLGKLRMLAAIQAARGEREIGPEAKFELKLKAPTGDSKMAQCWRYYLTYHTRYDRQTMIDVFVHSCDCTRAGAATYYSNCKKLYDNGIR